MRMRDELIKLAAKMLTSPARMSDNPDDWDSPKSISQRAKRIIFKRITTLDEEIKSWAHEMRQIIDRHKLSIEGIKELIEYAKSIVIIPRSELKSLSVLNCDHVIFNNSEDSHCEKHGNEERRGACCNSCWVRRWAKQKLKIKD